MALNNFGDYELNLDQLNGVTGGVITDSQKTTLNYVLKQAKNAKMSLDDVMALIPGYYDTLHSSYPDVTLEEVQTYVSETWDSL